MRSLSAWCQRQEAQKAGGPTPDIPHYSIVTYSKGKSHTMLGAEDIYKFFERQYLYPYVLLVECMFSNTHRKQVLLRVRGYHPYHLSNFERGPIVGFQHFDKEYTERTVVKSPLLCSIIGDFDDSVLTFVFWSS